VKWRKEQHTDEAEKAREKAQADLDETRARWPEVRRVAASLREVREANHFAERIESLIRGGPA